MSTIASESIPVLSYFRTLADSPDRRGTDEVLRGIAELFHASRVGMTRLDGTSPEWMNLNGAAGSPPLPWQNDGELMRRVHSEVFSEAYHDKHGAWLICRVTEPQGEPVLCWAHRQKPGYSEAEESAWLLASEAFVRWRCRVTAEASATAATQRRLETGALLVSRLIHDFGNFLTGIMGFTELSQAQADPDSTLGRYLHEVMNSAKEGAEWIRRLHLFSRRGTASPWPALLSGVLQAEETKTRTAGSNLRWLTDVPTNLPLLAIDAIALHHAIAEIVSNTRAATRDQGTLTLNARQTVLTEGDLATVLGAIKPGPCVELTMTDDGPGFGADASAKVFRELFYSVKPRHRGLGLLVVYGIMMRGAGGLRCHFGGKGTGATIQLYLPIANLGEPVAAAPKTSHVLLVHEDSALLETMRRILEHRGLRVTTSSTPAAAYSAYQSSKPDFDLVLVDVMMTGVAGPEMARKILDLDAKAKFLFVNAQQAYHALADDELLRRFPLLRWPTDPVGFLDAVQSALAREAGK